VHRQNLSGIGRLRKAGSAPKSSLDKRCRKSGQRTGKLARKRLSTACAQLMHNLINGCARKGILSAAR
jgi:hypothetical protein